MEKEDIITFCTRKGFIYRSCDLYGGLSGFYTYGHMGTLLKRNFENLWREYFLKLDDNYYEITSPVIMHENVFNASGHLENFNDLIIKCKDCNWYERADHFIEQQTEKIVEDLPKKDIEKVLKENKLKCPKCKKDNFEIFPWMLMFKSETGVINKQDVYLRPETAQSAFINFKRQYELQRKKLPLGLSIIGKAFRNEISPRNFVLRQREFTQAELQIFFNPNNFEFDLDNCKGTIPVMFADERNKGNFKEVDKIILQEKGYTSFYIHHMFKITEFYKNILNIPKEKIRFYEKAGKEKAFYNKFHMDIEINFKEYGWIEVAGLHYRTDHDLAGHQKVSSKNMEVDDGNGNKFIPHVLELSFGVDRNVFMLLDVFREWDEERKNFVLKLPKKLSPRYVSVLPLVKNKENITNFARDVYDKVKCFNSFYDESGSVGRRYSRNDEIGTPFCVTIDFDGLEDDTVTVRSRDTKEQERIKVNDLVGWLYSKWN